MESRVRFVASDPFGGGNLRSFWPSAELQRRGVSSRCELWLPRPTRDEYETIVIHRPLFPVYPQKVKQYQEIGMRVIVDEDDDLSRIHETKNEIGLQEWVPEAVKAHDIAMQMADALTVATEPLADHYRQLNPNVAICRNALPAHFLKLPPMRYDDTLRVNWAGITMTHRHDLEWIAPVFDKLIQGAMFSTVGDAQTPRVLKYTGPREVFEFASDPVTLYRQMARAAVGIVPLLPCRFNEAKSWLKALEYMTQGVPVVATDLPEQRLLVQDGVNGFLAKTPEEFAARVQELLRDEALRHSMATAAKATATAITIENLGGPWEDAVATDQEVAV